MTQSLNRRGATLPAGGDRTSDHYGRGCVQHHSSTSREHHHSTTAAAGEPSPLRVDAELAVAARLADDLYR